MDRGGCEPFPDANDGETWLWLWLGLWLCEETALLVAALPLPPVPKPIVQPPLMLNRIDDGE